jgi:hypothetical protein
MTEQTLKTTRVCIRQSVTGCREQNVGQQWSSKTIEAAEIQGGSNMTGTCLHTNSPGHI